MKYLFIIVLFKKNSFYKIYINKFLFIKITEMDKLNFFQENLFYTLCVNNSKYLREAYTQINSSLSYLSNKIDISKFLLKIVLEGMGCRPNLDLFIDTSYC